MDRQSEIGWDSEDNHEHAGQRRGLAAASRLFSFSISHMYSRTLDCTFSPVLSILSLFIEVSRSSFFAPRQWQAVLPSGTKTHNEWRAGERRNSLAAASRPYLLFSDSFPSHVCAHSLTSPASLPIHSFSFSRFSTSSVTLHHTRSYFSLQFGAPRTRMRA